MKRTINQTSITFSILALLALGTFLPGGGLINAASAQTNPKTKEDKLWFPTQRSCSARTIKGSYSYTAQGSVLPGSPLPVPPGLFSSIGTVTLDGFGNITEHITNDNFNGLILPATNYTGTYTVDPDCNGTAVLVGRAPYKFSVGDGGRVLYFMLDAPDTIITGTATRQ